MNPLEIIEPLRQLADRLDAYSDASLPTVRRCIMRSGMIGGRGRLIALHNDKSQPTEIQAAAGLAAGSLGAAYAGRITPAAAAKRLRVEADEIQALDGRDKLAVACSMWTAGSTWREVTVFVDSKLYSGDNHDIQKQIDACTRRVKRYAKDNKIRLQKRNPGRKAGK